MSEPDAIPLRPRARPFTPLRVALGCVLLLALGFIGGVEVQKRSGSGSRSGGGAAAASRFAGRVAGGTRGAGGGAAGAGATIGQVADKHGRTLYVTEAGGTTVKVRTNANTKVTRTAVSHVSAIHPGDTVVVQGSSARNGTARASRVSATASNAGSPFGGRFGGAGSDSRAGG